MLSPMPRANTPLKLKLLPAIAAGIGPRASSLGLLLSTFLGILVWNDFLRPNRSLRARPRDARLVRVAVGASLRAPHRRMARTRARALGLSFNAYLETLLASQLARPRAPLIIFFSERK